MRRGLFIGLGAIAVLLWWKPWRKWTQYQSAEQLSSLDGFNRATSPASPPTPPYSPPPSQRPSEDTQVYDADTRLLSANSTSEIAQLAFGSQSETIQPIANLADNDTESSAQNSKAEDTKGAQLSTDFSEFDASSDIAGFSSSVETSSSDAAGFNTGFSDLAEAPKAANGVQASDSNIVPPQSQAIDQDISLANTSTRETSDINDDLEVIEGIGPKTAGILRAAGINTFSQIAETEAEQLHEIVREGGITTANPTTWPMQARLAVEAKWDELKELQEEIKNGRLRH